MTAARVPYGAPVEPDEYVYTSAARIACSSCGEWIYPRKRRDGRAFAFPPTCQVCGAEVKT